MGFSDGGGERREVLSESALLGTQKARQRRASIVRGKECGLVLVVFDRLGVGVLGAWCGGLEC